MNNKKLLSVALFICMLLPAPIYAGAGAGKFIQRWWNNELRDSVEGTGNNQAESSTSSLSSWFAKFSGFVRYFYDDPHYEITEEDRRRAEKVELALSALPRTIEISPEMEARMQELYDRADRFLEEGCRDRVERACQEGDVERIEEYVEDLRQQVASTHDELEPEAEAQNFRTYLHTHNLATLLPVGVRIKLGLQEGPVLEQDRDGQVLHDAANREGGPDRVVPLDEGEMHVYEGESGLHRLMEDQNSRQQGQPPTENQEHPEGVDQEDHGNERVSSSPGLAPDPSEQTEQQNPSGEGSQVHTLNPVEQLGAALWTNRGTCSRLCIVAGGVFALYKTYKFLRLTREEEAVAALDQLSRDARYVIQLKDRGEVIPRYCSHAYRTQYKKLLLLPDAFCTQLYQSLQLLDQKIQTEVSDEIVFAYGRVVNVIQGCKEQVQEIAREKEQGSWWSRCKRWFGLERAEASLL